MRKKNLQNFNTQSGFTLIELIVAIGIFAVVMTISMGAFLNISDIQKKSESLRNVSDNMSFAIELMTRDIREGKDYSCGASGCGEFNFTDIKGNSVNYKLTDSGGRKYIARNGSEITSHDVNVNSLIFSIRRNGASDGQPFVTIYAGGITDSKQKLKSSLDLQASVSQRKIDSKL